MAFSNLHAPPISASFWDAVITRLDTAALQQLTRAPGRVSLVGDDVDVPFEEGELGGRVVVVPVQTLWTTEWLPGSPSSVPFLVRTDWNPVRQPGYDIAEEMEAAQRLCFEQLQSWDAGTLSSCMVAFPVFLFRAWQPRAQFDAATGLVFLSAEYRCQLVTV